MREEEKMQSSASGARQRRAALTPNERTVLLALTAGLYWTWWDSFHEIGRFAGRFFESITAVPLFGTEVYLSCIMKPLGLAAGCLVAALLVRRFGKTRLFLSGRCVGAVVAAQAVLHFVYYGLLGSDLRVAAFCLYGVVSALVAPVLLRVVLIMAGLGERRVVAVIMGALAAYGVVNNLLFPYAYVLIGSTFASMSIAYAFVLCAGAACLLRVVSLCGGKSAEVPGSNLGGFVNARTPVPLLFHLVTYGAVFGILHILEGYVQQGPFSINLGVFFGCLVTIALLAVLFFVMGNNHELWSKMRSTVFPLAIVGYLLIPLASNSDFALAFTEAGNLLYLAFLFIGCLSLIRRTAVDPRIIVLRAVLYNNLGTALGALVTVNLMSELVPGSQDYFVLSIVVTLLLTAATFWVGTDEQIRKIWGLRRKMSAKRYNDAATKARVAKLAERHGLTPREADILLPIAQGRRAPEMTDALGVSMGTVRTHVKHLYAKLDVHSYAEAVKCLDELPLDEGELS